MLNFPYSVISVFFQMFHWLLDSCCIILLLSQPYVLKHYFVAMTFCLSSHIFCSIIIFSIPLNGLELSKTQGSIKRTSNVLEVLFSPKKFIVSNAIAWHFWMEEAQSHLVLVIVTFTQCGNFSIFLSII